MALPKETKPTPAPPLPPPEAGRRWTPCLTPSAASSSAWR